jgi:hypothetical protein
MADENNLTTLAKRLRPLMKMAIVNMGGGDCCFVCDGDNTYGGDGALALHSTAKDCVAIGFNALAFDTQGSQCVAVGSGALENNLIGLNHIAVGFQALHDCTFSAWPEYANIAIGTEAGAHITTGYADIAIGTFALHDVTTARGNIAIGDECLVLVTERDNIGIGLAALYQADNTYNNIGIGTDALWSFLHGPNNSKTGENIAIGSCALFDLAYGDENIGISKQFSFYYGEYCVFIGMEAGDGTECGSYNIGVGAFACTGAAGEGNTSIGENALWLNTYGVGGNWIDEFSDYSGTVPGTVKAHNSDPWGFSLAPGVYTDMRIMGAYHYNGNYTITVIDAQNFYFTHAWAGDDFAAGYYMALLNYALYANNDTAIGYIAGVWNDNNSECTYIGYAADADGLGVYVNSTALGANSVITKSNQMVIGDSNIVENLFNGSVLIGTVTDGMTEGGSLAIAQDLAHRGTKIGFFNTVPIVKELKANHNNWANISDIVAVLLAYGLVDSA